MKKIVVEDRFFPNIINKNSRGLIIKDNLNISDSCSVKLIPRDFLYENVIVEIDKVTKKLICDLTDEDLNIQCENTVYNLLTKLNCYMPYADENSTVTIIEWNPEKIKVDSTFIIE